MREPETHLLEFKAVYASGAEEWYCRVCGRRLLIEWMPVYKVDVVEPGNERAVHAVSARSLHLGSLLAAPAENDEVMRELEMGPWPAFLDTIDLASLLDDPAD